MAKRHCSKCGRAGHYVSTCSARSKPKAKSKSGRSRSKAKPNQRLGLEGYIVNLENTLPGHNKSWSAKIVAVGPGKYAIVTRYGKINGSKTDYKKVIGNRSAVIAEFDRLVRSKIAKGYESVSYSYEDFLLGRVPSYVIDR